mmetsp:Transcript_13083/g.30965  ORF Transcript_13083/g.30965 Transcript_13083/m.30965 type:complete len:1087 (+) Transcript_13083:268-3528(+)
MSGNVFDVGDIDFDRIAKRRDEALKRKAAERGETLLQGMDKDTTQDEQEEEDANSSRQYGMRWGWKGWGGGKKGDDGATQTTAEEDKQEPEEILYGGKRVVQWPYDDYHIVQQKFYTRLAEIEEGGGESKQDSVQKTAAAQNLQRPPDPPIISKAVQDLALVDFEAKAEERAIASVSTWLFDCGLIDELLENGGMSSMAIQTNHNKTKKDDTGASLPSQEGIEVGLTGGLPIEGPSKMDKEMSKLKSNQQRTLTLINSRLNDGVAASSAEVQELVNAVNSTKDELGRLRELSTYISSSNDDQSQKFMLTKYPKLKKAINARRNLAKCFRELDFYSKIPITCDELRDQLHSSEWTDEEWYSLREVSRKHVELEIFLVEAELGMKKRIDEDIAESTAGGAAGYRPQLGMPYNHEEVDNFLQDHVKNVWELGEEIRMRIQAGIGNAFELTMENPGGMVALVEAVEHYESANLEYKTVHGQEAGEKQTLRFTNMRAFTLKQIYQDFHLRGENMFNQVHEAEEEAEYDDDEAAANAHFSAVLRTANGLTSEMIFVQNQMCPCFPPYWSIETLWATCVAHICSKEILEQIGGKEGHLLPELNASQLLDLVAWVENFRETIEASFPNIMDHVPKVSFDSERPQLLGEDAKSIDMEVAKDALAYANRTLWEVHDLAKDEFLFRTKEQTDEWLIRVYEAEHNKSQTAEGRLITSLCEDVYSLAGVQLTTIRERLTKKSDAMVQAVGLIFKNLYEKQIESRNNFLTEFETCCAASNDFIRMSDNCEEILNDLMEETNFSESATEILEEQSGALLGLYSSDAVFAAQKIHLYVFEPIEEAIAEELFGKEWLNELTHNDLALTLVRTIEDFMGDLEEYLDELMVGKTLEALITATVLFYIRTLLAKSSAHTSKTKPLWGDNDRALERIRGDIQVMRDFFEELADAYPSLPRVMENEFGVLDTFYELLSIANGSSESTDRDFVILLQKKIKNIPITKYVVGDLFHMVNPAKEEAIYNLIDSMEDELVAVAPTDEQAFDVVLARQTVPGLRLDQELAKHCDESRGKRARPGLSRTATEEGEIMLNRWKKTWNKVKTQLEE